MKSKKGNRGQGLVEFALLIPLVIFMLFIFIDLAWMISNYLQLSSSVREVTRYAMVNPFDQTELENLVKEKATSLDPDRIEFIDFQDKEEFLHPTPAIVEKQVIIVATYRYVPITPGLNLICDPENPIILKVQSSATLAPNYQ